MAANTTIKSRSQSKSIKSVAAAGTDTDAGTRRRSSRLSAGGASSMLQMQEFVQLKPGQQLFRGEPAEAWKDAFGHPVAFFGTSYEIASKYATKNRVVNAYTLVKPVTLVNVCNPSIIDKLNLKGTRINMVAHLNGTSSCRRTSQLANDIEFTKEVCKLRIDGKKIDGFATQGAKNFHDEIALCRPSINLSYPPQRIDLDRPSKRQKIAHQRVG